VAPEERCEECGFDYNSVSGADAPAAIRAFARRYRAPLTRFLPGENGDEIVRTRPDHGTWSALEYGAHVRDVFGAYDERVRRTLVEDLPEFDAPDPDTLALEGLYNQLDPAKVADEIGQATERLAATMEAVPDDGWARVGIRYGEERSVLFTAQRAVHEGNHHLLDIGRVLRSVRAQAAERKAAEGA
jgi:hypothetical protein